MRIRASFGISGVLVLLGAVLRLGAQKLAWPNNYSFSGTRADTRWAHFEVAIAEVGLMLMAIGGLLATATLHRWLKSDDSSRDESNA